MKSFQELCDNINLLDFAMDNGYRVVRESSTRRNPVLKGPDGDVIVLKDTGIAGDCRYFNASEGMGTTDRGNLIEFTKQRIGTLFPLEGGERIFSSINKVLHDYLNIPFEQRAGSRGTDFGSAAGSREGTFEPKLYNLKEVKGVNAYLQSRGISPELLRTPEFKGRVWTNIYNGQEHVAFPFYGGDNKAIIGLNFRSGDVNKNAAASNRAAGLWTSNIPSQIEYVVITESPIDCISYSALADGKHKDNTLYVATFGRPSLEHGATLAGILEGAKGAGKLKEDGEGIKFITAFDNDYTGQMFSLNEGNFTSDGSYIVRAGVDFKKREIEVHIWNTAKLTDRDKLMIGYRDEEGGARRVVGGESREDNAVFMKCAASFEAALKNTINEEMLSVCVTEKGMSVRVDAIPETARALNRAFCASFNPLQVMEQIPVIPRSKDFNEDLKRSLQKAPALKEGLRSRSDTPSAGEQVPNTGKPQTRISRPSKRP